MTPTRLPPVLQQHELAALPDPSVQLHRFLQSVASHGDVVGFSAGGRDRVLVNDAEFVTRFLQEAGDETREAPINTTTGQVTGDGLLTSVPPRWLPRRLVVQRELSHRRVRTHLDLFATNTSRWLQGVSDGRAVDLAEEVTALTLQNLGDAIFAADFRPLRPLVARVLAGVLNTSAAANSGQPDALAEERLAVDVADVDAHLMRLIAARRENPQSGGDVLGVLVEKSLIKDDVFNATWVRDEAMTLLLAGHDTTALLTTMALWLLARYPQVRSELRAGLLAARRAGTPVEEVCEQVPLVRQVLQEALRLYPPVPVLHRLATEDVEVGGYTVPAGRLLVFSAWVQHRDPRYFPEPLSFDPRRFAADRIAAVSPAYLPFGAGRRICAGNHFATLQAAMIVSLVTMFAEVEVAADEPTLTYAVALRLADGLPAWVHPSPARSART